MSFKERKILKILIILIFIVYFGLSSDVSYALTNASSLSTVDTYTLLTSNADPTGGNNDTYTIKSSAGNTYSLNSVEYVKMVESGRVINDTTTKLATGTNTVSSGSAVYTGNTTNVIGECFTQEWVIIPKVDMGNCIARILYVVLWVISFILGFIGVMFNTVFSVTVVNMKTYVESIEVISVGWTAIRDMANILFIFMLLYLAISTILQLDEHGVKHGLSRLIIGATLINFSLFFVKIPIDVSNIVAIEVYNKIKISSSNADIVGGTGGLGDAFLSMFSPQQVFADPTVDPDITKPIWNFGKNPITTFVMGIIVMSTACFIFLAVIIIFIKRFITLIMLMIFSPLAFAGMAIPNHSIEHEISSKFWGSLLKESFYAPVFMFMVYLTLKVGTALNVASSTITSITATKTLTYTEEAAANVISYSVVIGMLIFSLTVSEMMGVKGASGAIQFFDKTRGAVGGWVGRNTAGTLAYNTIEKTKFGTETLKQMRQGVLTAPKWLGGSKFQVPTWAGGGIVRGIGNMTTQGLQKAGEGHHHDLEADQTILKDTLNELRDDPKAQAEYVGMMMKGSSKMKGLLQPYNQKVAKYVGTSMKDEEVATMAQFMRDAGQKSEADTLMSYLGKERKTKINEIIDNDVTRAHKIKMGDQADALRLATEYESSRLKSKDKIGEIVVVDSHGHEEKLSGDKALKHLQDNYGVSAVPGGAKDKQEIDKGQVVNKIKGMFSGFSEKQKTGILSSLSAEQQKSLAHDKEFMGEMAKELTNYRMMEQTMKGGMAKEMQDELQKIAYRGLDRVMLYEALQVADPSKDAADIAKMKIKWKEINKGMTKLDSAGKSVPDEDYTGALSDEMSKLIKANKTFSDAKQNFTRFAIEDGMHEVIDNLTKKFRPSK